MRGFPQFIWSPSAIFRVGPDAERHGDDWRYAVVVQFPWLQIVRRCLGLSCSAVIRALSADGEFNWSHAQPILGWVRSLGYTPVWDRVRKVKNAER